MDKLRIAPSLPKATIHVLITQYINRCHYWEWAFKDMGKKPYMDLAKKATGFHRKEDIYYEENVWNRWFVQPELKPNELWWAEDTIESGVVMGMNAPIENIILCHDILKKYYPNKMNPKGIIGKTARTIGKLGFDENKNK